MILLNSFQAFQSLLNYIEADSQIDSDSWEVSDVLSLSNTDKEITKHTGGLTVDPAVWQDWKEIITNILNNEHYSKLKSSDNYQLTREQALKAMSYFLNDRYWKKKPNMLLTEVVSDLYSILQTEDLEKSDVWKEWLSSVNRSLSFKEIFE